MHRRTYLGAFASAVALAGCTGDGGDRGPTPTPTAEPTATPTPEPTRTQRPEPTETPTAAPEGPRIERAAMVWNHGTGDWLTENAIESAGVGAVIELGFDYLFPAPRDEPAGRVDVRITDASGSTVESNNFEFEFDASRTELVDRVGWVRVDMEGHPSGRYTAELTVTNRYTRETSDPARVEFELVEPLGPSEVALLDVEPTTVPVRADFSWTLRLANRSDRSSSIVGSLSYSPKRETWSTDLRRAAISIPADATVDQTLKMFPIDNAITYEWTIPSVGISWETEFVESSDSGG